MRPNIITRLAGALSLAGTLILQPVAAAPAEQGKRRPDATLRVNPVIVFIPGRVVATIEFKGGADDYQEYYCPKIEWIWGDGPESQAGADCDPYEAGKSEIRRRYTAEHQFKDMGNYDSGERTVDIIFRMKQGSKTVLSLRQQVRLRGEDGIDNLKSGIDNR